MRKVMFVGKAMDFKPYSRRRKPLEGEFELLYLTCRAAVLRQGRVMFSVPISVYRENFKEVNAGGDD